MSTSASLDSERQFDSGPILGGRLLQKQVRMVRGLRARLGLLRISRSASSATMQAERQQMIGQFEKQKSVMKSDQAANWRTAMTEWDIFLDNQFAIAERETLLSINYERQQTKQLKTDFVQNKAEQKSKFDNAASDLKTNKEEACLSRKNARDNIRAKLDK